MRVFMCVRAANSNVAGTMTIDNTGVRVTMTFDIYYIFFGYNGEYAACSRKVAFIQFIFLYNA